MIKTITLILYLMSDLQSTPVMHQIPVDSLETCIERGSTQVRMMMDTAPENVNYTLAYACEVKVVKAV